MCRIRPTLAAFGERLLRAREGLLEHHDDKILDAHPKASGDVHPRLDRHDVAGLQRGVATTP